MMNEEIRKFQKAVPFVPFEIELVGGRVLRVKHPDFIFVPPMARAPYFVHVDDDGVSETCSAVMVLAVRPIRGIKRKAG